ncbi:MAG: ParB/RepB/Spo0J family partition protein [Lachnospiraceae bacterium]|nr:ParB/RepB/Spo0J family partition protein [Lachnospiraceae bacterium]
MRRPQKDIQLTSYDDLLGINEPADTGKDKVIEIPLTELFPFKGHPFHVTDDEKMAETVESIRTYGVLNPALARPRAGGGYELVSGHRRKRGCELAGRDTMPVIVREYSDDEAVVIMVDSNIQRENILPSEKAFAYKMKMEALKHQGIKKGSGRDVETADLVGKEAGDSGRKVQRYIRLTELLPELLELVDCGKLKVSPAVSLSYLTKQEQGWVLQCITDKSVPVSGTMADCLKKYSEDEKLTELAVELVLCGEKKEQGKVTLPGKVKQYFPQGYSNRQIEQVIFELLENWKNSQ